MILSLALTKSETCHLKTRRTLIVFSLTTCIVVSKTMRARLQGKGFQVSSSSIATSLVSKVVLSSAIGIYLHVLGSNQWLWQ